MYTKIKYETKNKSKQSYVCGKFADDNKQEISKEKTIKKEKRKYENLFHRE